MFFTQIYTLDKDFGITTNSMKVECILNQVYFS